MPKALQALSRRLAQLDQKAALDFLGLGLGAAAHQKASQEVEQDHQELEKRMKAEVAQASTNKYISTILYLVSFIQG